MLLFFVLHFADEKVEKFVARIGLVDSGWRFSSVVSPDWKLTASLSQIPGVRHLCARLRPGLV